MTFERTGTGSEGWIFHYFGIAFKGGTILIKFNLIRLLEGLPTVGRLVL